MPVDIEKRIFQRLNEIACETTAIKSMLEEFIGPQGKHLDKRIHDALEERSCSRPICFVA